MAGGIDVDTSDFDRFGADLLAAAAGLVGRVRPVVAKGALNIKQAHRAEMARSTRFGHIARSITYDTRVTPNEVSADIGPVVGGSGSLAHIAYFGGARGGGGTVRDPQEAAAEEQLRFEAALSAVLGDLL